MSDNPILRPVENAEGWTSGGFDVSGRESNPYLLVCTRRSLAFELPSSITKAQRPIPKRNDGQEARWESIGCPMVRGLNALAVSRFADNPNSAARRNWRARWESNPRLPNFFGCSIAVELRDCPRVRANFERRSRMRFCCRLGRVRWASGVIERRHSMPGIEPGPPGLSPRTVRPPYGGG